MKDIDTSFVFTTDAGGGDPDKTSPTLRRYHKRLWSKALPDGRMFALDDQTPDSYLRHSSELGEFWLSSDAVMATYRGYQSMSFIKELVSVEEQDAFDSITYTIGAMMVFPAERVNGKQTINGARGFHPRIADRMDLTLECIRRHYTSLTDPSLMRTNPMGEVLNRYPAFFGLFDDFDGYVNYFLLQDLVDESGSVRFFMQFDDFTTSAKPRNLQEYLEFRRRSVEFVQARNRRIDELDC